MKEGGVIASRGRPPPAAAAASGLRAGLIEIARRLDPLVLRWGK